MKNLIIENDIVVGCDFGVKSVVLPETTKTIDRAAFYESDLKEISLNDGLTKIEELAFLGTELKSIYIPKSVEYIGAGFVAGCMSLNSIVVNKDNKNYFSANNCLVERKTNKVVAICGNATIPDGVTEISALAFYGRSGNLVVEIPESVTKIEKSQFEFLSSLEFPITIKAKKNSYAIAFAKENEIEFVEM